MGSYFDEAGNNLLLLTMWMIFYEFLEDSDQRQRFPLAIHVL